MWSATCNRQRCRGDLGQRHPVPPPSVRCLVSGFGSVSHEHPELTGGRYPQPATSFGGQRTDLLKEHYGPNHRDSNDYREDSDLPLECGCRCLEIAHRRPRRRSSRPNEIRRAWSPRGPISRQRGATSVEPSPFHWRPLSTDEKRPHDPKNILVYHALCRSSTAWRRLGQGGARTPVDGYHRQASPAEPVPRQGGRDRVHADHVPALPEHSEADEPPAKGVRSAWFSSDLAPVQRRRRRGGPAFCERTPVGPPHRGHPAKPGLRVRPVVDRGASLCTDPGVRG